MKQILKVFQGQKYLGFFLNTASCCRSFSFLTTYLTSPTLYSFYALHWREKDITREVFRSRQVLVFLVRGFIKLWKILFKIYIAQYIKIVLSNTDRGDKLFA